MVFDRVRAATSWTVSLPRANCGTCGMPWDRVVNVDGKRPVKTRVAVSTRWASWTIGEALVPPVRRYTGPPWMSPRGHASEWRCERTSNCELKMLVPWGPAVGSSAPCLQGFGIPAAVEDYVAVADRSLTVVASWDDQDVGFLTLVSHGPFATEIYVMGVIPQEHGQGIGRSLLGEAESWVATVGVEYLQVKALRSRKSDEGMTRLEPSTRHVGSGHWKSFQRSEGPDNPALQMIKAIQPIGSR